jgi:hypothetical protein
MNGRENIKETAARLNAETARIDWRELERHYARGVLMTVAAEMDLVMTAAHMARDDKTIIEAWVEKGQLHPTTDENAHDWHERNPDLWAVVVAPWVLVQERDAP